MLGFSWENLTNVIVIIKSWPIRVTWPLCNTVLSHDHWTTLQRHMTTEHTAASHDHWAHCSVTWPLNNTVLSHDHWTHCSITWPLRNVLHLCLNMWMSKAWFAYIVHHVTIHCVNFPRTCYQNIVNMWKKACSRVDSTAFLHKRKFGWQLILPPTFL